MDLGAWDPLDHPPRVEVRKAESDDSDAEGGLSNVTRVILRPPGHSGKAKRGHLSFDASFETGNLGRVDFISEYEYDLFIRPDTCNPRYRIWFNFVVDNVRTDQRVIFNIVNISKTKTLFSNGMTPLIRTTSRPKWQRLGGKYVYYHKSPEHRNHYVLTFAFLFDREEDVYQFAFTFPYSYAREQFYLDLLKEREFSFLSFHTVAASIQGRKVEVITIANSSAWVSTGVKRHKVVVIMARSHPGDSATSFIAQGILDFMVSSHLLASILRDHVIVKIIPMVNPDGVFMGNQRCSVMGYDFNRHWNQISQWSHPILYALKAYFQEIDINKATDLDIIIDLHAHTTLLGCFIYGNSYDDVYRFERHILFPKLLGHFAEDYNPTHTMYNRDPSKAGTARRSLCDTLRNTVNIYSLEVSVLGYNNQKHSNHIVHYNEDAYYRLGRNIVRTLAEYYKVTGVIPLTAFPAPTPKGDKSDEKKKQSLLRASRPSIEKPPDDTSKAIVELSKLTREPNSDDELLGGEITEDDYDSSSRDVSPHGRESGNQGISFNTLNCSEQFNLDASIPRKKHNSRLKNSRRSAKKPAYQTFDFSVLESMEKMSISPERNSKIYPTNHRPERGACRKVGGGGLVGGRRRSGARNYYLRPEKPSLTIVDFNVLVRVGTEVDRLVPKSDRLRNWATGSKQDFQEHRLRRRKKRKTHNAGYFTDHSGWDESGSDEACSSRIVQRSNSLPTSPGPLLHYEKIQLSERKNNRQ